MKLVDKLPEKPKTSKAGKFRKLIFNLLSGGEVIYTSPELADCQYKRRKLNATRDTMPIEHEWVSVVKL